MRDDWFNRVHWYLSRILQEAGTVVDKECSPQTKVAAASLACQLDGELRALLDEALLELTGAAALSEAEGPEPKPFDPEGN